MTIKQWHDLTDAIQSQTGFATTLEGGGAACPFIRIELPDGRIVLFGDVNETWMGDLYADAEAESRAEILDGTALDTNVAVTETDAKFIANAVREQLFDVCLAGNPAILGVCGQADCICARTTV